MRLRREFLLALLCFYVLLRDIYKAALYQANGELARDKRYLVYPRPGETYAKSRVQLIFGLGIPMEVDVSMIIGYVFKFNYALPHNASYLTDPYVRYDRSINGPVQPDGNDASSPPGAKDEAALISRWEYYEILESIFEPMRSGKACLLKSICEAAAVPFGRSRSLTAQLVHAFLTPSTTSEPFRHAFDQEYRAAEVAGRRDRGSCERLFTECPESLLEYFTEITE
ncbi:hypothetical protein EAI_03136 [Harpegnathos saltator]|uniref:Uncharacterized protein n=1 Tax=Harpegnathos saltator TaxID=610380 RepID=E2B728_HARSA|nr:hypothetical protein EAI_03136 [Harpegnathos saltator]